MKLEGRWIETSLSYPLDTVAEWLLRGPAKLVPPGAKVRILPVSIFFD